MDGPGLHYIRASYGKQAAQVAAGQSRMLRSKPPAEAQACARGIINSVLDAGTPYIALHPAQCSTASATPSVVLKPCVSATNATAQQIAGLCYVASCEPLERFKYPDDTPEQW